MDRQSIYISFSPDSLFGAATREDLARVDVEASLARYGELLEQRLRAEFPDADVTVEQGDLDVIEVDYRRDAVECDWVRHYAEQVYQGLDWWVEL